MSGYRVLGTGHWIMDNGYWLLADGLWFLDCHGLGFKAHGKRQKSK